MQPENELKTAKKTVIFIHNFKTSDYTILFYVLSKVGKIKIVKMLMLRKN